MGKFRPAFREQGRTTLKIPTDNPAQLVAFAVGGLVALRLAWWFIKKSLLAAAITIAVYCGGAVLVARALGLI